MSKWEKIFSKICNNPNGIRFSDLVGLANRFGFFLDREPGGSHKIFLHRDSSVGVLNLQPDKNGYAKPYQVRQLISKIRDNNLRLS